MSSSKSQPELIIGWTGNMAAQNFGAWVIESPTPSQLSIFQYSKFSLSQACFAPPELMEKAESNPPPIWIALTKERGVGVWVLRNPTDQQLQLFRDAEFPIEERRLVADPDTTRTAGTTLNYDLNVVPEVVSMLFARPTESLIAEKSVFGWPKTGGVWALIDSTPEQHQALKEGSYDFRITTLKIGLA